MMATVHVLAPSDNWDDDFEFNPLSRTNNKTTTNDAMIHDKDVHRMSIASSDWDHDSDDHHQTKTNTILEDRTNTMDLSSEWIEPGPSTPRRANNAENWDDDFEDSPVRKAFPSSPGIDKASPLRLRRKQPQQPRPESWDDEFEAEEAQGLHSDDDMGYVERDEEDRTVTARPHRSPARLSNPPPPVPAIPLPFLLPSSASGPSPFPRSPTSSVFSVPTARPPSSAFTVTSTTHLRPSTSRSSSAFDAFPPSPPVHRERERRRLRKKSRPQGNTIELGVIRGEESEGDVRPTTPPPAAQSVPATPNSSGGAGALLSRIGSMKKWGVRRRKGSAAPSETETRDNITPRSARPQSQASISSISSSASSHAQHQHREDPPAPPLSQSGRRSSTVGPGPSWFFRSTSSPFRRGSTSEVDLSVQPVQPQTPTKKQHPKPDEGTPSRLVKRKSRGFVQLKLGLSAIGGHGDDRNEGGIEKSKERTEEKYSGLGLGRATESGKGKESSVPPGEKQTVEEKEGSRSFMGSVRRLSLAGRHRRTKSGVSLQNVVGLLDIVGFGNGIRDENITPTPESVTARKEIKTVPVTPSKTPTPKSPPGKPLLPPIELQPPSPPSVRPAAPGPDKTRPRVAEPLFSPNGSLPTVSSNASLSSPAPSTSTSMSPSRKYLPSIGSPQSVSLGRSSIGPEVVIANAAGLRRSSLGDLKIPERISQAQVGLRKDMERVREFASGVEKLKALQATYEKLVTQVQNLLDQQHHQQQQQQLARQQQLVNQQQPEITRPATRPSTPSFFANLPRPLSRNRSRSTTKPLPPSASSLSLAASLAPVSLPVLVPTPPIPAVNAYKQLASAYYTIRSKYRISWECAELLIELGSGNNASDRGPTPSVSVPVMPLSPVHKTGRERAITLNGEDSKTPTPITGQCPPPPVPSPGIGKAGWRASTGKHDLSQRQLVLLKEILSGGDGSGAEDISIPEESVNVNREWRWGKDGMNSTLTLPSESSSAVVEVDAGTDAAGEAKQKGKLKKKRRASRLRMLGLRDILRSFTRSQDQENVNASVNAPTPPPPPSVPQSTTSLSTSATDDSMDSHLYPHRRVSPSYGRRRPQTSSGPGEFMRASRPSSPYAPSLYNKSSPRRPSLASIFRIGRGSKPTSPEVPPESHTSSRSTSRQDSSTGGEEEEDWDRMDDAEDEIVLGNLDHDASATVRGKKKARVPGRSPYLQDGYPSLPSLPGRTVTPKRSVSGSQSSIWGEASTRSTSNGNGGHHGLGSGGTPPLSRVTKLSNVEEDAKSGCAPQNYRPYHRPPPRASSRSSFNRPSTMKSGSVRSMPPHPITNGLPDPTLAMTPENIRPLLENARGVHTKLVECIEEVKALLESYPQT